MNETILNLSGILGGPKSITTTVIDVKELCQGTIGTNLIVMLIFLLLFNFLALMAWRKIRDFKFNIGDKTFDLVWLIPIINWCVLVFAFVYAYNAW